LAPLAVPFPAAFSALANLLPGFFRFFCCHFASFFALVGCHLFPLLGAFDCGIARFLAPDSTFLPVFLNGRLRPLLSLSNESAKQDNDY
jgi:hypothetical protein